MPLSDSSLAWRKGNILPSSFHPSTHAFALSFAQKSNMWTGKKSYHGTPLHHFDPSDSTVTNPYLSVIEIVGKTLAAFDDDQVIPVFGFGDSTTGDRTVFPFWPDRGAKGFNEVLTRYRELTPKVIMSGPTNYAPVIEAAVQIVMQTKEYHILVIIAGACVRFRRRARTRRHLPFLECVPWAFRSDYASFLSSQPFPTSALIPVMFCPRMCSLPRLFHFAPPLPSFRPVFKMGK